MRLLIVAVACAVLVESTAFAGPPIVLESYQGARPADAAEILRPVLAELARRGFVTGDGVTAAIERSLSRPAGSLSAGQIVAAQRYVDQAFEHFVEGEYPEAITSAQQALALYATAPSQMSREVALRDLQFKALLVVGRSQEVLEQSEASSATIAEALRTFPDRIVSPTQFDPRVIALHRRVKAELTQQGAAVLDVRVDDPGAVVFVNERFAGTGAAHVEGLTPGLYRVFISKNDAPGRVHDVSLAPGDARTLALSWMIDGSLQSRPGFAGFELPRDATSEQEIAIATRVARALDATAVVVIGVRPLGQRRAIVGYAVQTQSQSRTFGAVQLEPLAPTSSTTTRLAALLSGDRAVDTSGIVLREPPPPHLRSGGHASRWYADVWGWGLSGAGIVTAASAGWLAWRGEQLSNLANDERQQALRRDLRDRASARRIAAGVTGGIAVGLLTAGVVTFASRGSDSDEGEERSAHLVVGTGFISIAGEF